jgi:hypothetical protein
MVTRRKQKPYSIRRLLGSRTRTLYYGGYPGHRSRRWNWLVHESHDLNRGSLIADKLTDNAECHARISAVSKAFGALKTQLFGVRHICTRAKKHVFEALVLSLFNGFVVT